jgi:hypothetical protein
MNLNQIRDGVVMTKASIDANIRKQQEDATSLRSRLDDTDTTLRHVRDTTDSTNTTLVSIRSLASQLFQT